MKSLTIIILHNRWIRSWAVALSSGRGFRSQIRLSESGTGLLPGPVAVHSAWIKNKKRKKKSLVLASQTVEREGRWGKNRNRTGPCYIGPDDSSSYHMLLHYQCYVIWIELLMNEKNMAPYLSWLVLLHPRDVESNIHFPSRWTTGYYNCRYWNRNVFQGHKHLMVLCHPLTFASSTCSIPVSISLEISISSWWNSIIIGIIEKKERAKTESNSVCLSNPVLQHYIIS